MCGVCVFCVGALCVGLLCVGVLCLCGVCVWCVCVWCEHVCGFVCGVKRLGVLCACVSVCGVCLWCKVCVAFGLWCVWACVRVCVCGV